MNTSTILTDQQKIQVFDIRLACVSRRTNRLNNRPVQSKEYEMEAEKLTFSLAWHLAQEQEDNVIEPDFLEFYPFLLDAWNLGVQNSIQQLK